MAESDIFVNRYWGESQEAGKRLRLERRKGSEGARSRFGGLGGFEGVGYGAGSDVDMGRRTGAGGCTSS